MKNINNDKRKTYFIDIDGTLVKHNYDPENIPEEFLPGALDFLKSISSECVILTTSRSPENIKNFLFLLA